MPMGYPGHHDAGLDAVFTWANVFGHYRNKMYYVALPGHVQNPPSVFEGKREAKEHVTTWAWYRGNHPRNHNFIPVPDLIAKRPPSVQLTGTQGEFSQSQQRGQALLVALRKAQMRLYGE